MMFLWLILMQRTCFRSLFYDDIISNFKIYFIFLLTFTIKVCNTANMAEIKRLIFLVSPSSLSHMLYSPLDFIFIYSCFFLPIIIKQGPENMISQWYSNPQEIPTIFWAFIPTMYQINLPENDSLNKCCQPANNFNGSQCQDTKDNFSPLPRTCQNSNGIENNLKMMKTNGKKSKKEKELSEEEQEFRPNAPEIRKSRRTPQNANRNVVPNIMHQVISFMQKRNKSEKLVEKFIKSMGVQEICSVQRFYYYQLLIKAKLNNYVNADSLTLLKELQDPLCEVYNKEEQRHYNKISRLLVQYFLTREYDSIILTSVRVNSDKKLDHLIMKRKILEKISEMFSTD